MKKPSFDMQKVKEFFFQKGERVGLGVAACITVLVLVMGLLGSSTSPPSSTNSPTWSSAIKKETDKLHSKMVTSAPTPDTPKQIEADKVIPIVPATPKNPQFAGLIPWYETSFLKDDKRRNPTIYSVSNRFDDEIRDIQVDFLRAPALVYEVDFANREYTAIVGKDKDTGPPALLLEPKRMVVVTAAFPIREQLEQFRQALRYDTIKELLAKESPRFLGLNIYRVEVQADGTEIKNSSIPLYVFDPKKGKTVLAENLDTFFRKMVIDTENPSGLADYLGPNMVTPLPYLASVDEKRPERYPRIKINGIEQAPDNDKPDKNPKKTTSGTPLFPGTKQPGIKQPMAEKGGGGNRLQLKWSTLGKELQERFKGNYNVFDPFGNPLPKEKGKDKKADNNANNLKNPFNMGPKNKFPMQKPDDGDEPMKTEEEQSLTRLLVRFIDIDVEVGKAYRYYIQVRVANPNFERSEGAITDEITRDKELLSSYPFPFTATPPIAIGPEYFYYAVDEPLRDIESKVRGTHEIHGNDLRPVVDAVDSEKTTVQIHRWVNQADENRLIGDWVVAERLLIRRGDPIGRKVLVEVPEWNLKTGHFELGSNPKIKSSGIQVDFSTSPQPILVDFMGGKHRTYQAGKQANLPDDAAVEMLILAPDGRLVVRNSGIDTDTRTESGRQRLQNLNRWRNRVQQVRNAGTPSTGTGIQFPKR